MSTNEKFKIDHWIISQKHYYFFVELCYYVAKINTKYGSLRLFKQTFLISHFIIEVLSLLKWIFSILVVVRYLR